MNTYVSPNKFSGVQTDKRAESQLGRALQRFLGNRLSLSGLLIILILLLVAVIAPIASDPKASSVRPADSLLSPNSQHLMGTDQFGRDVFTRIALGSQVSLRVSLMSITLAFLVGTSVGLLVGYYEGVLDLIVMRVVDLMIAFPVLLLVLVVVTILGPAERNLILAIGIVYIPSFVRVARASTLSVKRLEFVEAAIIVGARSPRILLRHILPNVFGPIVVQATLGLSTAILTESALNFLGLGMPPPTPSWGGMLSEGRQFIMLAPWLGFFPGLAIMLAVLGFNLLGDGLRDMLDPRT